MSKTDDGLIFAFLSIFQVPSCSWVEWRTRQTRTFKTQLPTHTQTPALNPKYHYLYLFVDQHEGFADTSGRGTIFLYMSVNKILIHVAFFFMPSFVFLSFTAACPIHPQWKRDEIGTKGNSRESHVNRTLYLHGPSQCKIEILLMEILTKRPFFPLNILFKYYSRFIYIFTVYSKYSFGSGLFTNRQVWQILVPVQRREGGNRKERGVARRIKNHLLTLLKLWIFV